MKLCFLSILGLFLTSQLKGQLLDSLLRSDTSSVVAHILKNQDKHRLQIAYTEILSHTLEEGEKPILKTHYFRNRPEEYFFPASLVKLPVAALALEKIRELYPMGISDISPFAPRCDFECLGKKYRPVSPQSLNDLIAKIFVYSDNQAYNYLFEFCSPAYFRDRMLEMGYQQAKIVEKIANCDFAKHANTCPIAFYDENLLVYTMPETLSKNITTVHPDAKIGKGYFLNGKYVDSPKDFSTSNFIPLQDLHRMLVTLVLPQAVEKFQRFAISEAQRRFLLESMGRLPSQYFLDSTSRVMYKDNYVKYIMGQSDTIPDAWKIRNKVGLAYGFMSDCTYFEEEGKGGIQFFLSAMLYVNENGVLNDGKYEYESLGLPFLKRLGTLIYQYEVKKRDSTK